MAQAGGLLIGLKTGASGKDSICYFAGIENAKFRKPVTPGDQLRFEIDVVSCRRGIWEFSAKAFVDGKLAAEASLKVTCFPAPK
jgi:3-hydroxyacyl-[acyl-carrier-protein] dehydratase